MYLTKNQLSSVFKNSIVVTIDLCIVDEKRLLLGKRLNPPAKDFYFVPGGRIRKGENIKVALTRILKNETGQSIIKEREENIKFLGVYEHFYEENFLGNKRYKSQYIVLSYFLPVICLSEFNKDVFNNQHSDYIWQNYQDPTLNMKIHNYTKNYFPIIKTLNTI
ncbi:MAG: NUDIX domain-containing protein [Prochlorococcus marinus XMU1422]|nr:NUDIX domain-containing protein [Prochlorococcus marinus XMU1421]MBO7013278.1 NUDIX domain-containing protein [Prochlorococcus marinus XMU1422]MCR8542267.1 NUDIX domain-containing protein [Prochlorococcus marinus XMU1423]